MVPSFIPAETYVPRLTSGYQIPGPSARTSDSFSIQTGFSMNRGSPGSILRERMVPSVPSTRTEAHTSELESLRHLVCRLVLEKKNGPVTDWNGLDQDSPAGTIEHVLDPPSENRAI